MASTYLSRSVSSNGNRQKFTISVWVKKSEILSSTTQYIFTQGSDSNNNFAMYFDSTNTFGVWDYGSGYNGRLATNRKFMDASAWYHIVVRVDTTLATAGDRMRVYVNGVQETSFSTSTNFSQDFNTHVNQSGNAVHVGWYTTGSGYFNGLMSHIHLCDGYSYGPDSFGATDATTGEWRINTNPSVSYGTNGFWWLKDNANTTDNSPNSNTFTVANGTLTPTVDNPSHNFCTFNPLQNWRGQNRTPTQVLNKGNLTTGIGSSEKAFVCGSIGVRSGKYYWEAKSDGVSKLFFGVTNRLYLKSSTDPHSNSDYNGIYYYEGTPDFRTYGSNTSTTGIASISTNDILGFALDMDNHAFYIHKNGTYMNSGDPTSGASKTGSIAGLFTYGINVLRDYEEVFPAAYVTSTSGSGTASFNFGNGYFGTTAVSSAGTNASNIGTFEYNVPAGYTALSTKGLNE